MALAARLVGTSATIFMASDAAVPKVQATRGHGAEIVFYDRQTEDIDPHVLVDILRAS